MDQMPRTGRIVGGSTSALVPARSLERRRLALTAGWSLLAMAVVAGLATFGVIERLSTADDLAGAASMLRLAAVGLLTVAALDLVVAWALYEYLAPVDRGLAGLAGLLRAAYAVVYVVAIAELVPAARLADGRPADALDRVRSFTELWEVGLTVFGLHLVLGGWLAVRSGDVPGWVGVRGAVSGAGYLFDSLRRIPAPGGAEVTTVTFVGEVVLLVWLLVRGGTTRR